jgi:hypothetical protein
MRAGSHAGAPLRPPCRRRRGDRMRKDVASVGSASVYSAVGASRLSAASAASIRARQSSLSRSSIFAPHAILVG